ncbi:hypothetical protein PTTG_03370 [Puccinia triticina 1-1 BBBD Race 1]|uniref:Uncharacterized protein n=1 Tax=Puccinia triticina (isolate 1-1 / race 1 (BBBD)) TaxID=630390 RepID=A0A180GNJ1_PUCT1|nr:hypothetical protein PTTG_03370 [Puccinia triticina 1-1 BBBD Race 1]
MPPHSANHILPPQYQDHSHAPVQDGRAPVPSQLNHSAMISTGTSVATVESFENAAVNMTTKNWGKWLALKGPNCWNLYLKNPEAHAIFRETNGIDHESAMPFFRVSLADPLNDGLTAEERALDDNDSDESPPADQTPGTNGGQNVRREASFKNNYAFVQSYVNNFVKKSTHIAASRNVEFAIFAVSKHLGPSMFQISQSTPGSGTALDYTQDVDAKQHYAARLQSHRV